MLVPMGMGTASSLICTPATVGDDGIVTRE